jgi:hypothetical protein
LSNEDNTVPMGKLVAERMVSKETIKISLMRWWRIKGTATFSVLGENLFLVEFELAKDKTRVLEAGSWDFEGKLFLVVDFDGRTSPSEIAFNKASFWVRMTNLPLACMGREVGFKLGASVGKVEEVDTDKDEVGWGEFLRVKILIDLYKPLSQGRMLKFDGKSTLVGFKYERLPKFCFYCEVIRHGVESCLKRSTMRNQDIVQYGLWMRANSPPRCVEKSHEHWEPARFQHSNTAGASKREGYQDMRGYVRRKRTNSGEDDLNGGPLRGRHRQQAMNGENDSLGENLGGGNETFQTKEKKK